MKMELLEDLYLEELKDLYDAEKQLTKALPKLVEASSAPSLRQAFEQHTKQTEEQIQRLEQIFKKRGDTPTGKRCKAMAGLVAEVEELLKEEAEPEILDVGLITAAQKVEHYEIAGYGCAATYARLLGFEQEAKLLGQTLQEEKETDGRLTLLAEEVINEEAAQGEIPGEEEEEDAMEEAASGGNRSKGNQQSQRRQSSSRKVESDLEAGESKTTTSLEEIRQWAESRGGKPATVMGTERRGEAVGLLRIDFPDYSGEGTLETISWEEWFAKFEESKLAFLYQDKTKDGKQSRFFKLVCKE